MDFTLEELATDGQQIKNESAREGEFNPFEVLGISIHASSLEIREAYLRLKSTFQSSNDSIYSLMSSEESKRALEEMERAYDALRDIDARGKYLQKLDPKHMSPSAKYAEERSAVILAKKCHDPLSNVAPVEPTMGGGPRGAFKSTGTLRVRAEMVGVEGLDETLKNILAEDKVATGATLVSLREASNLTRQAVEFNIKVSPKVIEAVESDDFRNLPAPVYVRGFLKSFFKFLDLGDQREFIDKYTERLNERK